MGFGRCRNRDRDREKGQYGGGWGQCRVATYRGVMGVLCRVGVRSDPTEAQAIEAEAQIGHTGVEVCLETLGRSQLLYRKIMVLRDREIEIEIEIEIDR